MKKITILLALIILPASVLTKEIQTDEVKVPLTGKSFTKPADATAVYKSKRGNFSFSYNPEKWKKLDKPLQKIAELSLGHESGNAYALIISERKKVPLKNLEAIVLQNAKNVDPNAEITSTEDRIINGNQARFVEIEATLQGITFIYHYYLFSSASGYSQILVYTAKELYPDYSDDFSNLLNGYVGN